MSKTVYYFTLETSLLFKEIHLAARHRNTNRNLLKLSDKTFFLNLLVNQSGSSVDLMSCFPTLGSVCEFVCACVCVFEV